MFKETMKQIVFWILVFCAVAVVAVFIGWYQGLPNPVGMFGIASGIAMSAVGYYAWKARAENIEKIKQNGVLSPEEMALIIQIKENCSTNLTEGLSKIISEEEMVG